MVEWKIRNKLLFYNLLKVPNEEHKEEKEESEEREMTFLEQIVM